MRWLILAACLFLPIASAQSLEAGDLGVEDLETMPETYPLESSGARLELVYSCADTDLPSDTLSVHVDANATRRSDGSSVPIDTLGTVLVDLGDCRQPGRDLAFRVDITWTTPDYDEKDILDLRVRAFAEAGEGATYRATDTVDASRAVPMFVEEELVNETMEIHDQAADEAEYAPGPALPLLAAGLLAIARRR